jgi:uncharacterized protein (TIGR02246 family)
MRTRKHRQTSSRISTSTTKTRLGIVYYELNVIGASDGKPALAFAPSAGNESMSPIGQVRRLLIVVALLTLSPAITFGGPAEDAGSVINEWVEAFNANDVESLADLYASDAILIGTTSSNLIEGKDGVRNYFARLAQSGDKVLVETSKVIVAHDNFAYVTGFYTFGGVRHGHPSTTKAGFTMILVKRGSKWLIAHHHSSRRSAPTSADPPLRRG